MSCGSDSWEKGVYVTVPFGKASAPYYLKGENFVTLQTELDIS